MNLMYDKYPEIGDKFFAIFSDGSGGSLFMRIDDFQGDMQFLNAEGDDYTQENMDDYLYWQKLPEYVTFWFENRL